MATKILKQYQEKTVAKLASSASELLGRGRGGKTIVFQSPTGSGKTIMMGALIEEIIAARDELELCFLWVSIGSGKLHEQSYNSLKREFGGFPAVHLLEREFFGSKRAIERNEVVIVNWDKLNQKDSRTGEWKNALMKSSETWNFREVLANTKEDGLKIVLIIDESHTNAGGARALEIRDEIICPDLTIEMSATPDIRDPDAVVKVDPYDVIEEGMIKKEIVINEGLGGFDSDEENSESLILKTAFSRRGELAALYRKQGIAVNPLALIQLPSGNRGEEKLERMEAFLAQQGVSTQNGKLAIWLSEEKINLELLHRNDDEVEFLIFKQAIATGWDCPRAQVLVRFREIKSLTFSIQTVGRVLRMPEGRHYDEDALNRAYVYVNAAEFDVVSESYNPNIIKSLRSLRRPIYGDLKLRSYYRNRIDFGGITASFQGVLRQVFNDYFEIDRPDSMGANQQIAAKKIAMDGGPIEENIMLDAKIRSEFFDSLEHRRISADDLLRVKYSEGDIDYLFEDLIRENLNGYAPKRSIPVVEGAIYAWFKEFLGINPRENLNYTRIVTILLKNRRVFSQLLDRAVQAYKPTEEAEKARKIKEIEIWNDHWEIALERRYNPNTHSPYTFKRNIYDPCYLNLNDLEKAFAEFIDADSNVLWWWQNGSEHMALNFGIKYGIESTFQPDFIVAYQDGRIGIFDTKAAGQREEENRAKGEALQQYIKEENQKGKGLFGGLVVRDGAHFKINQRPEYSSYKEKPSDWGYLERQEKS